MNAVITKSQRGARRILACVLAGLMILTGCAQAASETRMPMSTVSLSNTASAVSDEVLDMVENPVSESEGGEVEMTGGESVIDEFLTRYANSMTTLEMYDYSDICADTAENAVMMEYIRYRLAFFRKPNQLYDNYYNPADKYNITATETSRNNKNNVLNIRFKITVMYENSNSRNPIIQDYEWNFDLKKSGDSMKIVSSKIISYGQNDGFQPDIVQKALEATGMPLNTPKQIHAAGDEVIRYFYKNSTLPKKPIYLFVEGSHPTKDLQKTALLYTDQYYLIHISKEFNENTMVGLANKKGEMLFDMNYNGFGVTKKGYFILNLVGTNIITGPDGYEVARYNSLECYKKDASGNEIRYEATDYRYQPSAPYLTYEYEHGYEYRLLDENFNPVSEIYNSMTLTETGAMATKDGTLYKLDKNGKVVSKTEPHVIKTFFGKYQLKMSYNSWEDNDVSYGLLDEKGNTIYEQKYCKIEMPFEDRVLLFSGDYQSDTERAALLGDTEGCVFNKDYNYMGYLVTENDSIGIAQSTGPYSRVENNYYEAGYWLVDKDGKRISKKYAQIGNAVDKDGKLYVNTEDTTSPLVFKNEDGTVKTVPLAEVMSQKVLKMGD